MSSAWLGFPTTSLGACETGTALLPRSLAHPGLLLLVFGLSYPGVILSVRQHARLGFSSSVLSRASLGVPAFALESSLLGSFALAQSFVRAGPLSLVFDFAFPGTSPPTRSSSQAEPASLVSGLTCLDLPLLLSDMASTGASSASRSFS